MRKITIFFSLIFLLSATAFAQTITWTSNSPISPFAPPNVNQGTNTHTGSGNSGSITLLSAEYSCVIDSTCETISTVNGLGSGATWERHYFYSLTLYDTNGNIISFSSFTDTGGPTYDCAATGGFENIVYKTYQWTTAPGSPAVAYIKEEIGELDLQLSHTDNVNCQYSGNDTTTSTYPLSSPFSGVLLGPLNNPLAVGTTNNDDYTNKTLLGNIVGSTTSTTQIISFQNTVRNKDTVTDSAVITAPTVPSGFTVEASPDCSSFTNLTGGGNITISDIPGTSNATFCVRITAPSGIATFMPFSTLLRATSVNDPIKTNDTIDRIYSGFINTSKSATVTNSTGVGGVNDPVPGAVINYFVNYQNIANSPYGSGNYDLVGTNVTITEDGNQSPNNWGTYTTHIAGGASDTNGGLITGDIVGSNLLTDIIPTLNPQQSGVFLFRRTIK